MVTACVGNWPTDCPAVYESVLVRERLVPFVFAVGETGKVHLKTYTNSSGAYFIYLIYQEGSPPLWLL